jgi:hypothetical protein
MKTLIAVSLLAFCGVGVMTAPVAAQVSGPHCLFITELEEVAQFFALPTAGGQAILTGQSITFEDAYTGSGYIRGNDFIFSLASGLLPGLLEGIVNLTTGQGLGSITFADTGEIQSLTYSTFAPPCTPR